MEKVLSIIIPTYNMENYLNRCLDSLIVDNMDLLEVLVINDGSKDRSSEIAHTYSQRYPGTFKVIDKENGNYGSCINRGLKEATGKYVKILDADDYYRSNELNLFLEKLKNCNSDIAFTTYTIRKYNDEIEFTIDIPSKYENKTICTSEFSFEESQLAQLRKMHCMCTKIQLLKDNNYFQTEGISYTDTQFVFYSFLYSKTISFFNLNIYQYCLGRDGQTMSPTAMIKNNMHFYLNARKMLEDYSKIDINTPILNVQNLRNSIRTEITCYYKVISSMIHPTKKQCELFKELIQMGKSSTIPYDVSKELMGNKLHNLWDKYGISLRLLITLARFKTKFYRKE